MFSSLSQQAHQEIGSTGVQAERRHGNVGGGVGPVLMIVLHAVQHSVGCGRFTVDHLTCDQRVQHGTVHQNITGQVQYPDHRSCNSVT